MKRYFLNYVGGLLLCMGCVGFQACSDWLDVTPEAQVNDKKMFSTPQGYKDVLNGIYVNAAKEELYAKNLLFGFVDVLAQYYDVSDEGHELHDAGAYRYHSTKVVPIVETIWKELYFCIANCNILLERLEQVRPDFFGDERTYYIIRGEAKALRAFFHFDLLRLYAPAYRVNPEYMAIPYVTRYTNEITPQSSVCEVLESVTGDLKSALKDLENYDPVLDPLYVNSGMTGQDGSDIYMWTQPMPDNDYFLSYRGFRLNYYAVNGLLARVYSYMNKPREAYEYARVVLDAEILKFANSYYVDPWDPAYRDRLFRSEILFAFYAPKMNEKYFPYSLRSSMAQRWLTLKNTDHLFANTPLDYRRKCLLDETTLPGQPSCIKYLDPKDSRVEDFYGMIAPMIRMSELYYIVCEYLATEDLEQAKTEFGKLRSKRNAKNELNIVTADDLRREILNDARREFIGEGQMFYFYKRCNRAVLEESGTITMTEKDFVLPLPDVELEFGERLSVLYAD